MSIRCAFGYHKFEISPGYYSPLNGIIRYNTNNPDKIFKTRHQLRCKRCDKIFFLSRIRVWRYANGDHQRAVDCFEKDKDGTYTIANPSWGLCNEKHHILCVDNMRHWTSKHTGRKGKQYNKIIHAFNEAAKEYNKSFVSHLISYEVIPATIDKIGQLETQDVL